MIDFNAVKLRELRKGAFFMRALEPDTKVYCLIGKNCDDEFVAESGRHSLYFFPGGEAVYIVSGAHYMRTVTHRNAAKRP